MQARAFLVGLFSLLISDLVYATSYQLPLEVSLTKSGEVCVCVSSRIDRDGRGVKLQSISFDDPSISPWSPIWALYAEGSDAEPVKCFTYGRPVGGLTQHVAPAALQVDKPYRIEVSRPGENGVLYFKLLTKGNHVHVVELDKSGL